MHGVTPLPEGLEKLDPQLASVSESFLVYDVTGNYLPLISFFQFPSDLPTLLWK